MQEDTIHFMMDDEILEYMQDLIAGRQPPNVFANQHIAPEEFPVLIQVPKYNLVIRALEAKIDLVAFSTGLARLVADGTVLETGTAYLIALEYVPPDERDCDD